MRLPKARTWSYCTERFGRAHRSGAKDAAAKFAEALAIAKGRILAVGSNAEIQTCAGRNTKVVDLKGRLAVPGLIDSHTHFIGGGFQLLSVDLKDARSEEEFTRRIGAKARRSRPDAGCWAEIGTSRRGRRPSCPPIR